MTATGFIVSRGDGRYFALDRHETRWVEAAGDATVFATLGAVTDCILFGRLSRIDTGPLWTEGV